MRSALTEQLAGVKPQAPAGEPTKAPLKLLGDRAFPCLRYAKGEVVEAIESSGYEETDVSNIELPGTAPSSSLRAGMVRCQARALENVVLELSCRAPAATRVRRRAVHSRECVTVA
jgi:hypothetical protein